MNNTIENALNEQIKNEFDSAFVYLSMSSYLDNTSLPGFAKWMRVQYEEESAHALRLFDFLLDLGGRASLKALPEPPLEFSSPLDVFEQVLAHEKSITKMIHELYALAVRENDYATQIEMQWFITEQVEEEKNADDIVQQLKLAGDSNTALLMLDRELGQRAPAPGGEAA